jgi:putative membrane protein
MTDEPKPQSPPDPQSEVANAQQSHAAVQSEVASKQEAPLDTPAEVAGTQKPPNGKSEMPPTPEFPPEAQLEIVRAPEFLPDLPDMPDMPPEVSAKPEPPADAQVEVTPPKQLSLAEVQFELARIRTSAALDRTLLAWVRTSLSLICFGFTLARVVHELITHGSLTTVDEQSPLTLGIGMMLLGMFGLIVGSFEHMRAVKRLRISSAHFPWSAALWVTLGLIFIGLILMISLLKDLGPLKHSIHY